MTQPAKLPSATGLGAECFPIRVLSERTGVGSSTLRAWERRYGLLTPQRTPKGHRLYTANDVRSVERVITLLGEGHSLAAVARQIKENSESLEYGQHPEPQQGVWADYLKTTLRAVYDFSAERVEAVYNEASSLYPVDMVTERLVEPVLARLGEGWPSRNAGIAEEHFYTNWLRNRLGARFHHASSQASGARILCACLPESHHEIGLMLFAISAMTRGYRVLYLGSNLPLEQVEAVVGRSGVRGLIFSSRAEIDASREKQLVDLRTRVKVPILLGGPGSDRSMPLFEQAGGVRLGSRIAVALRVLGSHVPVYSKGVSRDF